ncbi:FtsX-like permease family protein [Janibacter alittae]|uniref:FtsX-like permease family protein n=1 Tax=Janibacter alittae TaxID=3115209 RepID=A0ABZ2MGI8_9MICO
MWAALRHRRGQVIALALVSALVATCAVFAPVFARSVDQGLMRVAVEEAGPVVAATAISQGRSSEDRDVLPSEITEILPDALTDVSQDPIEAVRHGTTVVPQEGKKPSPVVIRSRTGMCEHLEIEGACPSSAGEIIISSADAKAWGWKPGRTFEIGQQKYTRFEQDLPPVELTVVGIYQVTRDAPGYWLGDRPDGKSGVPQPDMDNVPALDDFLTVDATFADSFPHAVAYAILPLDPDRATLEAMPRAADAATALAEKHPELRVDESAQALVDGISTGRAQTDVIIPFVMVQLALLSVLVLFLVAQSAVDQRRHDVALSRLRGRSRTGARRLLLTELSVPVLLGLPLGLLVALGMAVVVRRWLLPPDLPFEVPLTVLPWVLGALLVSVLAVYFAARPVLRESVNDLLRSVRPSTADGSMVVEAVVVVLALLGVAGLSTGVLSGPAALATPTLLAIAVGVLAARVVPSLAARRASAAVRRGRVAAAISGHAIARRPAARRVLVVTTVATAVAVFGANAVVVADQNRQARAELETGAHAVASISASSAPGLLDAAAALRDKGITAAPVAVIRPHDETSSATIAVDPERLRQVAHPSALRDLDLEALALPEQQPIILPAGNATATVGWDLEGSGGAPPELRVEMTTPDGGNRSTALATLGPTRSGRTKVDTSLYCSDHCRLAGLTVAVSGDTGSQVRGTVTITDLAVGGERLPVADGSTWTSDLVDSGTGVDVSATGDQLRLHVGAADGADVTTYVTDVPRPVPAIVSSPEVEVGDELEVIDVSGGQTGVVVDQHVAALPAVTDRGVLLSLPALSRVNGEIATRADKQIWLADASPAAIERAGDVLAEEGAPIRSVTTTQDADRVFDESASGWGLQLAVIGGALAVLLAALVLVILAVTGWRAAARDLAALRISGVGQRAIARSLRTEHLVTVAVGVVLGAACSLLGSRLAMPSIPLFTTPAAVPAPDLSPHWPTVLVTTVVVAAVLLGLALAIAAAVARRVRPAAVRGESS